MRALVASSFFFLLIGCAGPSLSLDKARIETLQQPSTQPVKPAIVYVEPFDLGGTVVTPNHALLTQHRSLLLNGSSDAAATHAAQLSDVLTRAVLEQLTRDGLPAQRFTPGGPLPNRGWLVAGKVLTVDEGNRLRRAVIGFGQGASDAQLYVAVSDLTKTESPPFTELDVDSSTGKAPGAVVTLNPYVAAAKFVLAKNPSEKDMQRAGAAIADAVKRAADNAPPES